jgi:hypothetical protein
MKDINTIQTSFLLKAEKVNSSTTIDSSSIRFYKKGKLPCTSLSFKIMDIAEFSALLNDQ